MPTLGEALDACAGVWVNIEIKNDASASPTSIPDDRVAVEVLADARRARRRALADLVVPAGDRSTAAGCVDPSVPTAWLTVDDRRRTTVELLVAARPRRACTRGSRRSPPTQIERCHDAGLARQRAGRATTRRAFVELAGWGIDGICTDVPDVMRAALAER